MQVSNIEVDDDRISFDVDQIGQPVLVKTSYFPNWEVSGAEGPYRVTPNLMVVVPTDTHVSLHYGWTPVELFALAPHPPRHRRPGAARPPPARRRAPAARATTTPARRRPSRVIGT